MMSLDDLVQDETRRQQEFPVCEQKIFLAHAGVSPLPRRVSEAMGKHLEAASRDNQEDVLPEQIVTETRQMAARLIEARAEEIAFVGSTSMGLAMVAAGLPWEPGDNVVCYRDDYPANVYPWMNLASRGVEVRFVEPRQYGNVTTDDLERVLDRRTRLVSLASVHFVSGWRLDVNRIGQFLHDRGVLFCLDGIQSFGALRTSMQHVDFAAADAHKWLLGPLGVAILFVRRERFEVMHPPLVGWHSATCPDYVAQDKLTYWPDARRYEPGSLNLAGLVGLHAALKLILDCGIETVEARVLDLARKAIEKGEQQGLGIMGARADDTGLSGIVSFVSDKSEVAVLHVKLAEADIVTSLRQRRDGVRCLRLSPHFYNSFTELDEWKRRL
jgi:cysteine desulfurase/selenocysteine lyase